MNLISLLSSVAMAVGLAASLPQILRMLRTRSSGGQSVLGWGMGLVTNLSMAYVNLVGFGAAALMASNVLSAALCVAAIVLIVRFGASAADAGAEQVDDLHRAELVALPALPGRAPVVSDHGQLTDMPTTEFVALRQAIDAASAQREQRGAQARELAFAA